MGPSTTGLQTYASGRAHTHTQMPEDAYTRTPRHFKNWYRRVLSFIPDWMAPLIRRYTFLREEPVHARADGNSPPYAQQAAYVIDAISTPLSTPTPLAAIANFGTNTFQLMLEWGGLVMSGWVRVGAGGWRSTTQELHLR